MSAFSAQSHSIGGAYQWPEELSLVNCGSPSFSKKGREDRGKKERRLGRNSKE